MPTLRPMIPWTAMSSAFSNEVSRGHGVGCAPSPLAVNLAVLFGVLLAESLDLDVDARRQIELHERVHGLRRRLEDVEEALVRPDLELLAALLVDVGRAERRPAVLERGKGDRLRHARAGAPRRVHDLARGLVEDPVVVSLESDPDLLVQHHGRLPFSTQRAQRGAESAENG